MEPLLQKKRRILKWAVVISAIYLFYIGTFRGECISMRTWPGEQHYIYYTCMQYAFGRTISRQEWWEPGPPPVQVESCVCNTHETWRGFGLLWRRTRYLLN